MNGQETIANAVKILEEVKTRLNQAVNIANPEGVSVHWRDYDKTLHIAVSHHKNVDIINVVVEREK